MADDDDRPTVKPPRPSTRQFAKSGADSKKVDEAQDRILEGLRVGVKNLVDRFFDSAKEIVRGAILHAGLDLYQEGIARGATQSAVVYRAYLASLDKKYQSMPRDPRVEITRPSVMLKDLRAEVLAMGIDAMPAELAKQCTDIGLALAADEE